MNEITVIVLTYNEENNIERVLDSVTDLTSNIFVVDSYSTDRTIEILKDRKIAYVQHEFDNYSIQRNWAQMKNPFSTEWVLHLDADEPISSNLLQWILVNFSTEKNYSDGFMFSRKTIFMSSWIKHGGQYPNFHLRLYKASKGKCEDKAYDQHFVVDGFVRKINNADIINTVLPNLDDFIISHNRWASKEAEEVVNSISMGGVRPSLFGNSIERRRWLKQNIFERSPLFLRSFMYFFYRYILRLGFLDGKSGLIFFVLQTFWFRFLIDAKVYEHKLEKNKIKF